MRENNAKHNKIIIAAILGALLFVFLFSKIITKPKSLKKPHEIENILNFTSLPSTDTCQLLVGFGSFASGIDYKTHSKIVEFLRYNNSVKSIESYANGREGEHVLCVKTKQTANNKAIYKEIRKMIPAYSNKGYTSLEMAGVKKFQTKWK